MQPLAIDLLLLRSLQTSELKITPGRVLMARVVHTDQAGRGALSIAGALIEAQLPAHVRAGQDLRLVVREVDAGRVVLTLSDRPPAPAQPPAVPLPGGGTLEVLEREEPSGGGPSRQRQVLALRYDAPSLGPVDLRFELDPAALRLSVTLGAGEPFDRGSEQEQELRATLEQNVERTVTVKLQPRREPLNLYA